MLDDVKLVYSPNGGLAYIYLAGDDTQAHPWKEPAQDTTVLDVAKTLYFEAQKGNNNWQMFPDFEGALGKSDENEVLGVLVRNPNENDKYMAVWWIDEDTDEQYKWPRDLQNAQRHLEMVETRINEIDDLADAGVRHKSRAGDIILLLNRRNGYDALNDDISEPGTHGGPTVAESHVPLYISFEGFKMTNRNLWVNNVLSGLWVTPRTTEFKPMVEAIFNELE